MAIMPGVEIGDGAVIAGNPFLAKDTKAGPGESAIAQGTGIGLEPKVTCHPHRPLGAFDRNLIATLDRVIDGRLRKRTDEIPGRTERFQERERPRGQRPPAGITESE